MLHSTDWCQVTHFPVQLIGPKFKYQEPPIYAA